MDKLKKQKVRKIVIFSVLGILLIGGILKLTIEPADYHKTLNRKVEKAETMLSEAEIGNAKGQYSEYVVTAFKGEVTKAKQFAEDKEKKTGELREESKSFSKQMDDFKKADNRECLTKEEVGKLKSEKKDFEKTVKMDEDTSVSWKFNGKDIEKAAPMNLQVIEDTFYEADFETLSKKLNAKGRTVAFLHNGKLPCTAKVTMPYKTKLKDLQVYAYDEKEKKFGNLIRAEVKDGQISFPVSEGGLYVILELSVDDAAKVSGDLKQIEKEEAEKTKAGGETAKEKKESADHNKSAAAPAAAAGTAGTAGTAASPEASKAPIGYCTVEIRCDTIVDTSKLTNKAVAGMVPANGTILAETRMPLQEGDTAFDILQRAVRDYGIQMEAGSKDGAAYVEGINNIYEFDAGTGSGWMYKINGWFPNYGSSNYVMKPGDKMVWCYTCNVGKDIGN